MAGWSGVVDGLRAERRALGWAAGVFAVLVGFTAALWGIAHGLAGQALVAQTEVITEQVAERIRGCVVTRVEMIRAIRHEWSLGGLRDDHAFTARADALLTTFPGFLAVNRIDTDGTITFVHPPDPNRRALGQNVAAKELARGAFGQALADDTLRLTPPLELFQGGTGIAAYVPTRTAGEPTIVINGVFRADTLIPACLGADNLHHHALSIRDGDRQVFARAEAAADEPRPPSPSRW